MGDAAGTGLVLGAIFLTAAAYGTLALVGGGLYLAWRKAVRREVDRLLRSVPDPAESETHGERGRS